MKICGIVAEYNPFHNGHKYHIEQTRLAGATHIVAVMSGNTVQRGDIALFDKHFRAKKACENGANLVLELPCPYSCANAEVFSRGAMQILSGLGCVDALSFGCENADFSALLHASNCLEELDDSTILRDYLTKGYDYPTAISLTCGEIYNKEIKNIISSPNNLLALEYIKSCKKLNLNIDFLPIKRVGVTHDSKNISGIFCPASYIRERIIKGENISEFLPYNFDSQEFFNHEKMFRTVVFKLKTMSAEELMEIPDCTKELAVRIEKILKYETPTSLSQLYNLLKTKNITHARIRRVVLYSVLGIKDTDFLIPPYARILACDEKGIEVLKIAKNTAKIPISHSLTKLSRVNDGAKRLAQIDVISSDLQKLCGDLKVNYPNEFSVKFNNIIK